jgi:hypothetical protein
MAAELSPSWFKMTGSLASLQRLMGWQAPGLTCKVKSRVASLANMRSGDFVFFTVYALAGLVPPLSSFWKMYTGVNDIMWLDRGPGSSLGDTLLAASLKVLTTDQPSAELMMPAAGCEPLCVNQAPRTALLVIMPMLDDVDIAPVQRGDQSRSVVIPRPGGPGGAASGHGHGGVPVGDGPAGSHSGAPVGGRGGTIGGSNAAAPSKGRQARVVLDDDEVLPGEDEPL